MELKDLIAYFKYKSGLNNTEFAKAIGINRVTLSRWESGEIKSLNSEAKENLSQYFELDVDQYLNYNLVKPLLGTIKAGYNLTAVENIEDYLIVSPTDAVKGDYFLRVTGDSMVNAQIYPGSLIYVKATSDVPSGSIAVVLINGDEATVKKVIKKDDVLILEAANPTVPHRYFTLSEIEKLPVIILGQVLYTKVEF